MIDLIKMLKVISENMEVLHRNIYGLDYFPTHYQLWAYYDMIQAMKDDIIEISIGLGENEPSMADSLDYYVALEVKDRNSKESFIAVKVAFENIIAQINRIKDVPADVINKLQEYQETLRKETTYKLDRAIR